MNPGAVPATQWEGQPVATWAMRLGVPRLMMCDVVSSTSDVIRQLAVSDAPAGTLCVAEHQTAGRGQHGRTWSDAAGRSLMLSMLFRPPGTADGDVAPGALPIRVGIAVAQALGAAAAVDAGVKWPNDLAVPRRGKIGGILCEAVNAGAGGYVVVGVGMNVTQQRDDFPHAIRDDATSVRLCGGTPDRGALLMDVVSRLRAIAEEPLRVLDAAELGALDELDLLRGRSITVADGEGIRQGVAMGIRADGALNVDWGDVVAPIRTGTVRLAEPPTPDLP